MIFLFPEFIAFYTKSDCVFHTILFTKNILCIRYTEMTIGAFVVFTKLMFHLWFRWPLLPLTQQHAMFNNPQIIINLLHVRLVLLLHSFQSCFYFFQWHYNYNCHNIVWQSCVSFQKPVHQITQGQVVHCLKTMLIQCL